MLALKTIDPGKDKIGILAIPICQDKKIHTDPQISALVKKAAAIKEFSGKTDETLTLYDPPGLAVKRLLFWGAGKQESLSPEIFRALAGRIAKKCIKEELDDLFIVSPDAAQTGIETTLLLEAFLEGACLGNHVFDRYLEKKEQKPLKKISLCVGAEILKKNRSIAAKVTAVCQNTLLAREWVSIPSNEKRPEMFAKTIADTARQAKLRVSVWDEKALRQKKFGALLAVAAGSESSPRMVILDYRPQKFKKTVALVGKGVTFDTGGINLKPSANLNEMKADMSGAAAVAATLLAVTRLKPKMRVVGLLPLVENMPSGSATRPGDIVRSYSGKTVEIGNTDAEGRLILIDTLAYAVKTFKPEVFIDLATLTGACVVALGDKIAGLFTGDDPLAETLLAAGVKTHERCWRMPLPEDYKEYLKSDFADINNLSNSRYGGAITAALFLSEFVSDTRWAHIDIAGPAYAAKGGAYCNPGGTGFGVRLLCEVLAKL